MANGIEFFYYIKCRWDDKLAVHQQYMAAAQASRLPGEQIKALTMHIQLLCRLNRPQETSPFFELLSPFKAAATHQELFHINHARALYHYARGEYKVAQHLWAEIVEQARAWSLPGHMPMGALHWLGLSAVRGGEPEIGRGMFTRALQRARADAIGRWIARNQIHLALLDIDSANLAQARNRLDEAKPLLAPADREQGARMRRAEARLLLARNSRHEAATTYAEARDLFARMGLLHELADDDRLFGL